MASIELTDKAVSAIRGRSRKALARDPENRGKAAEALAALDNLTDYGSVDFDDEVLAWLYEDGRMMRGSVEERLGLVDGVAIDWENSEGDAFYVWAVEDISARSEAAAKMAAGEYPGSAESLEPAPRGGSHTVEDVDGITAELTRLEAWWDAIEDPPVAHPDWAISDEIDDWGDGRKSLYGKTLELIAAGKIDPVEAATAALADPRKAVA